MKQILVLRIMYFKLVILFCFEGVYQLNFEEGEDSSTTVPPQSNMTYPLADNEEACPDYNDVMSSVEWLAQIESVSCDWVDTGVTEFYLSNGTNIDSTTENSEDCIKTDEAL